MLMTRRNQNWLPNVFNDFFDTNFLPKTNATAPAINVIEKDGEYDVELAAPGMGKEDFKVSLDQDGNLVIDLEKKIEHNEEGEKGNTQYLRREFSYTHFHKSFIMPEDVDSENISARAHNGVLTVVLPKKTAQEMKKEFRDIEIQ